MLGESDATLRQRISAAKADVANIISAKSVTRTAQSLFLIVLLLIKVFVQKQKKVTKTWKLFYFYALGNLDDFR